MPIHRLYVCTTCVRDRRLGPGERSQGARLCDAVEQVLGAAALDGEYDLLRVPCLNGCLRPCNVALRAPGKFNLRFSRITALDALDVVRMLATYLEDPLGDPPDPAWPAGLRGKLTVHTAPPHLLLQR